MTQFRHYPTGKKIPDSIHSVVCSLPTMDDVIGYEEKRPDVMEKIKSGYPRFVIHEYVERYADFIKKSRGLDDFHIYLLRSMQSADDLVEYLNSDSIKIEEEFDYVIVAVPNVNALLIKAKAYLQHTGSCISSRHAEDLLFKENIISSKQGEEIFKGDSDQQIKKTLANFYSGTDTRNIILTNNGANAFYAAFKSINKIQKRNNKTIWIQFGWLYVDTSKVLEKFCGADQKVIIHYDVLDYDGLEKIFAKQGERIAGIITETPTNPLMQTCDINKIFQLTKKYGAVFLTDPTMVTPFNINILPHSDLVINSLTKYAANEGDVMGGALVFNKESQFYEDLKNEIPKFTLSPYIRDLERLAHEVSNYKETIKIINQNTIALAQWLEKQSSVKKVYWAYEKQSEENYRKIECRTDSPGGIITITLNKPIRDFYDLIKVVKGPSFGVSFTLICPYLYLAHYDLAGNKDGQRKLSDLHLDANLIRISVGTENIEEIINEFSKVL